jgi:hypothetical protein
MGKFTKNPMEIKSSILGENSPQYLQPPKINIPLKPHQKTALWRAMLIENPHGIPIKNDFTEDEKSLIANKTPDEYVHFVKEKYPNTPILNTNVGIIADKVGAGKSFIALSLVNYGKKEYHEEKWRNTKLNIYDKNHDIIKHSNYISIDEKICKSTSQTLKTTIIVVPHNIIKQWDEYIKKFTTYTHRVFRSPKESEKMDNTKLDEILLKDGNAVFDVILMTNTTFANMMNALSSFTNSKKITIERLIIDEAHSIVMRPNYYAGLDFIDFTWIISSNHCNDNGFLTWAPSSGGLMQELKSVVCDQQKHKKYLFVRNFEKFVDQSFNLEEPDIKTIRCICNKLVNITNGIVSDKVKQMLMNDDIHGIMQEFNISSFTEEKIIAKITLDLQCELQNLILKHNFKEQTVGQTPEQKKEILSKLDEKIKYKRQQIADLTSRITDDVEDPITLDDIEHPIIVPCCHNKMGMATLTQSLSFQHNKDPKCPICNQMFNIKDIIHISCDSVHEPEDNAHNTQTQKENYSKMTKLEVLENLLQFHIPKNKKLLIFAGNDSNLQSIQKLFQKNQWGNIVPLQGHIQTISKAIDKYKNGDLNALFLNAQHYGCGLNLENTDFVISLHKMDPKDEEQIFGRAQRPGRTSKLQGFKIYYDNE